MTENAYRTMDVPVDDGELHTGVWGPDDAPTLVAVHGITANQLSFAVLAAALREWRIIAPDLRGRGRSGGLPGPWGMDRHADDVAALIRAVANGPVLVLGHSMGGFVATALVRRYPELVSSLVLVDGGLPFTIPAGLELGQVVELTLGPAKQRLTMTFPSRTAYLEFWRPHPAFRGAWSDAVAGYLDYDLEGEAPNLRSSVSSAAVEHDARDLFDHRHDSAVLGTFGDPARLVVVSRGLLDEPPGLYPDEALMPWRQRLPGLSIQRIPELNHYTIVLDPRGAAQIAQIVRTLD